MIGSEKRKMLLLLGLALIAIVIIAASLPQLELKPGLPLPEFENNLVVASAESAEPVVEMSVNGFFTVLFALILGGSTLYILYKVIKGATWKEIFLFLRAILGLSLFITVILLLVMLLPGSPSAEIVEMPLPTPEPIIRSPLGSAPPILLWLVGIGLLITGSLIVFWIIRSTPPRSTTIDLVGLEAEKAWQELKIGLGLKDVIIKCYRQMSLALEKDKGIERKSFMTTGEFEELLEAAGVPHDPIHELTRLFEAARYGNWQSNPVDEQKAIESLEAIMQYCQSARDGQ